MSHVLGAQHNDDGKRALRETQPGGGPEQQLARRAYHRERINLLQSDIRLLILADMYWNVHSLKLKARKAKTDFELIMDLPMLQENPCKNIVRHLASGQGDYAENWLDF